MAKIFKILLTASRMDSSLIVVLRDNLIQDLTVIKNLLV